MKNATYMSATLHIPLSLRASNDVTYKGCVEKFLKNATLLYVSIVENVAVSFCALATMLHSYQEPQKDLSFSQKCLLVTNKNRPKKLFESDE